MSDLSVGAVSRDGPSRLRPRSRKAILVVHVAASVGLVGEVWALTVLNIIACRTTDPSLAHAAYTVMTPMIFSGGVVLSVISLVTGVLLGLGTHWGLTRHFWVVAKLLLLLGVIVVGMVFITPEDLANATHNGHLPSRSHQWGQVAYLSLQLTMVATATAFSIYKPRRRPSFWSRPSGHDTNPRHSAYQSQHTQRLQHVQPLQHAQNVQHVRRLQRSKRDKPRAAAPDRLTRMTETPDETARMLRARELAEQAGDASWFETLYAEAERGESVVPWAEYEPNPHLTEWAVRTGLRGAGRSALVVGCGFGDDAEYVASLGFQVTAFDISDTAIAAARRRHADSPVTYVSANLLAPPAEWANAFDLVVEIYTVQPLYGSARTAAIAALPSLVAPGGTLLLIAFATEEADPVHDPAMMPWPLTRAEIEAVAGDTLEVAHAETFASNDTPPEPHWRVEYRRPH